MKTRQTQRRDPQRLAQLYREGLSVSQLGIKYHIPTLIVERILREQGIEVIASTDEGSQYYIPTPEQIEQGKKEVQESWSEQEENDRRVHKTEPMTIPVIIGSKYQNGRSLCQ